MTKPEAAFLFLAGPTASGKSALALAIAEALVREGDDVEIVNADSMQVYADLSILTARPGAEDLARAPHRLYGCADAGEAWSAGRWSVAALETLAEIAGRGGKAIVVGGTGLYFRALTDGLADVPEPGPEAEAYARAVLNERGIDALRALAERLDPAAAAKVLGGDRQRLLRLVSVARGVGRPLSEIQRETRPPEIPGGWTGLVLEPERSWLHRRINARAERIIDEGGPEEAARLVARGLHGELPAMKALGVAPLARLAAGEISRAAALEALAGDTRRYAKRQLTWFRNQTGDWPRVAVADVEAALATWRGQARRQAL